MVATWAAPSVQVCVIARGTASSEHSDVPAGAPWTAPPARPGPGPLNAGQRCGVLGLHGISGFGIRHG